MACLFPPPRRDGGGRAKMPFRRPGGGVENLSPHARARARAHTHTPRQPSHFCARSYNTYANTHEHAPNTQTPTHPHPHPRIAHTHRRPCVRAKPFSAYAIHTRARTHTRIAPNVSAHTPPHSTARLTRGVGWGGMREGSKGVRDGDSSALVVGMPTVEVGRRGRPRRRGPRAPHAYDPTPPACDPVPGRARLRP